MKKEVVLSFTNNFDDHSHTTENCIGFWFARDMQHLLGYSEWRNFYRVILKARITCEATNNAVSDHFVDVNETIEMPKGASKEIQDIMLTRYACYLIAQNDRALFGKTTQQMKDKLNIPKGRALAGFLPTITINAKDFATEIPVFNTKEKGFSSERQIIRRTYYKQSLCKTDFA